MKKNIISVQRNYLFQILTFVGVFFGSAAQAHDFWLEAHPFYTSTGKPVDISIHVGTNFSGDSLPNINDWYDDFSYFDGAAKKLVNGELGRDPAGYFIPQKTGSYMVGYQSTSSYAEIDSTIFMKYVTQEGLDNALAYAQKIQREGVLAKENFTRHAKALVQAGSRFERDSTQQIFGYTLEIIPLQNPYRKNLGETLDLRILYQGRPAQNILLHAYTRATPEQKQQVRSNAQGLATIKLDKSGEWLLKAVKIVRIKGDKADWQSHWASLTFAQK
jgi:uncharacterized GH25 family protein